MGVASIRMRSLATNWRLLIHVCLPLIRTWRQTLAPADRATRHWSPSNLDPLFVRNPVAASPPSEHQFHNGNRAVETLIRNCTAAAWRTATGRVMGSWQFTTRHLRALSIFGSLNFLLKLWKAIIIRRWFDRRNGGGDMIQGTRIHEPGFSQPAP